MKRVLIPFLSLALLGVGCAGQPAPAPVAPPVPVAPAPAPQAPQPSPTMPSPAPEADGTEAEQPTGETTKLSPATTDATWQTYTSAALKFSFQWPTKGRYAPEWEVKIYNDTDAAVSEGCYLVQGGEVAPPKSVMVGSKSFCHTSASEGAAGSVYFTDAYATNIGSSVAVILFTKHVTNGGMIPNCPEQYSSVSTSCIPFSRDAYEDALNGIIGTFTLTAN